MPTTLAGRRSNASLNETKLQWDVMEGGRRGNKKKRYTTCSVFSSFFFASPVLTITTSRSRSNRPRRREAPLCGAAYAAYRDATPWSASRRPPEAAHRSRARRPVRWRWCTRPGRQTADDAPAPAPAPTSPEAPSPSNPPKQSTKEPTVVPQIDSHQSHTITNNTRTQRQWFTRFGKNAYVLGWQCFTIKEKQIQLSAFLSQEKENKKQIFNYASKLIILYLGLTAPFIDWVIEFKSN